MFISYAHEDKASAALLAAALKESGISVWQDTMALRFGDSFADRIAQAIEDSTVFVVLISACALDSRWVRVETNHAWNHMKKILPVVLDGVKLRGAIFLLLGELHHLEVSTATFDRQLAAIIPDVRRLLPLQLPGRPLTEGKKPIVTAGKTSAQKSPIFQWRLWLLGGTGLLAVVALTTSLVPFESSPRPDAAIHASDTASSPSANKGPPSDMVEIPAGSFLLGRYDGAENERPTQEHDVQSFWMDATEVTNEAYAQAVRGNGVPPPSTWPAGKMPERERDHPVAAVSWKDAEAYCLKSGKRLPTEFEWEYAARGGHRNWIFSWEGPWKGGMTWSDQGSKGTAQSVKRFPPNPFGLYDMLGNVLEWTSSKPSAYPGSVYRVRNADDHRVVRGGHSFCTVWKDEPNLHKQSTTYRTWSSIDTRDKCLGFRCAWSPAVAEQDPGQVGPSSDR